MLSFHPLAPAMRARAVRGLRELHLVSYRRDGGEVMEALAEGSCPMLTVLHVAGVQIEQAFSEAFARAVRGGSLARLEVLEIDTWHMAHNEPMVEALGEGGCPLLQVVKWETLPAEAWLPLLEAMAERLLREIRLLDFTGRGINPAGVAALMEAMAQGHELEELIIEEHQLNNQPLTGHDLLLLVSSLKQHDPSSPAPSWPY
jgi:hypothetical protein